MNSAFTPVNGAGAIGGKLPKGAMPVSPAPRAGGAILAAAIIAGVVGGVIVGQPSIGALVGTGVGIAVALILWARDRKSR